MTARLRHRVDEAQRGLHLGAHAAARELAGGGVLAQLGDGDAAQGPGGRRAEVHHDVGDVGGDDQGVGVELAGEDRGGEVLVDDGLDAAQRGAVLAVVGDRDAAAAGADDDEAGPGQRVDRGGVDDGLRLGRGDHAAPALLAAVLPDLAERDEPLRLLARQEPADRLGGSRKPGSSASTRVRVTRPAVRCGRPRAVSAASSSSVSVKRDGGLGLGDAPVQRHRRHDVRGELVLDQQVAHLRSVAVGQDDLDTGGDDVGDVPGRLADGVPLGGGRRRTVRPGHGVAAQGDHHTTGSPGQTLVRFLSGEVPIVVLFRTGQLELSISSLGNLVVDLEEAVMSYLPLADARVVETPAATMRTYASPSTAVPARWRCGGPRWRPGQPGRSTWSTSIRSSSWWPGSCAPRSPAGSSSSRPVTAHCCPPASSAASSPAPGTWSPSPRHAGRDCPGRHRVPSPCRGPGSRQPGVHSLGPYVGGGDDVPLVRLLSMAVTVALESLHADLAPRAPPSAAHGYALHAISTGVDTASRLARCSG